MVILQIVLTVLVVLGLLMTVKWADQNLHDKTLYIKIKRLFKKSRPEPAPPPMTRMFVAIRRQPGRRPALNTTDEEEYEANKEKIRGQWRMLLDGWATLVKFTQGFHGSEYGLPSNNNENWILFASYEIASHDTFRDCLAFLGQEQFFVLRNQFDIHLLYGEKMDDLADHLDELFK